MGTLGRGAAREGSWGPGNVGGGQVLPVPLRPSSDHTQSTEAPKRAKQETKMEPHRQQRGQGSDESNPHGKPPPPEGKSHQGRETEGPFTLAGPGPVFQGTFFSPQTLSLASYPGPFNTSYDPQLTPLSLPAPCPLPPSGPGATSLGIRGRREAGVLGKEPWGQLLLWRGQMSVTAGWGPVKTRHESLKGKAWPCTHGRQEPLGDLADLAT